MMFACHIYHLSSIILTNKRASADRTTQVMVFFSSCNSVKFHAELLNYIDLPVMDIHGRQKQQRRTTTFFQVRL